LLDGHLQTLIGGLDIPFCLASGFSAQLANRRRRLGGLLWMWVSSQQIGEWPPRQAKRHTDWPMLHVCMLIACDLLDVTKE